MESGNFNFNIMKTRTEINKDYRERNREKILTRQRAFYAENKERMRLYYAEKQREFYKENTEKCKASSKKWRNENKEHIKEYNKRYIGSYVRKGFDNIPKGKDHHNWIKDRTQLVQNEKKHLDYRYRTWAKEVKDRDGWKCKIANEDCKGHLEAHHILRWKDFLKLRYEVNNGITLCHFHHPRKIKDEMKLSPFFQELVLSE